MANYEAELGVKAFWRETFWVSVHPGLEFYGQITMIGN
jgi:hypothetical protein